MEGDEDDAAAVGTRSEGGRIIPSTPGRRAARSRARRASTAATTRGRQALLRVQSLAGIGENRRKLPQRAHAPSPPPTQSAALLPRLHPPYPSQSILPPPSSVPRRPTSACSASASHPMA